MDKIYENIDKYYSLLSEIHVQCGEYFAEIKDVVRGLDEQKYNYFVDLQNGLKTKLDEIRSILDAKHTENDLKGILHAYDILGELESIIRDILNMVNSSAYLDIKSHNMSRTYIEGLKLKKVTINNIYNSFMADSYNDIYLFQKIDKLPKDEVEKAISDYPVGKVNKFYLFLLNQAMNSETDPNKISAIKLRVEEMKDKILNIETPTPAEQPKDAILKLVDRKHLIQLSQSVELKTLLKENFSMDSLDDLKGKYSVLIINKITDSDVEINANRFLNPKESSKIYYTESHPLTENTVKILDNVSYLSPPKSDMSLFDFHENSESLECVIIETTNGVEYHLLVYDYDHLILPLECAKKIMNGYSRRPLEYQTICNQIIMESCLDPQLPRIYRDYQNLGRKATTRSAEGIQQSLEKQFSYHYNDTTDPEKFENMVMNPNIINSAISSVLYKHYSVDPKIDELSVSFLRIVHDVAKEYEKELRTALRNKKPPVDIFKRLEKSELNKQLKGFYNDIHKIAFERLDKRKPSTWSSIELTFKDYAIKTIMKI